MTENYYITFDDIRFCIVNGRRGIRVMTLGELEEYPGWYSSDSFVYSMRKITKGISYSFFYWSPEEQRYVLQFSKLEGKLTDKDLEGLDKAQLRIMRKEVYTGQRKTYISVKMKAHPVRL